MIPSPNHSDDSWVNELKEAGPVRPEGGRQKTDRLSERERFVAANHRDAVRMRLLAGLGDTSGGAVA